MKRIALSTLFMLALLLTACGSPTPAATLPVITQPPASQPPAVEPSIQPVATETAPDSGGGVQVTITLADNSITASQTSFQAGVPYTFVITNNGHRVHNFNINPPASVAGSLNAALSQALLVVTKDKIGPGQTYSVEFTFPASTVGMQLEFSCLIQKHYDDGMTQAITVIQ